MKAIETTYRGFRFRSRLEARWAVFFDALALRWDYEPEGFDMDGTRYLPDFLLHTRDWPFKCFVEVKRKGTTEEDWAKAKKLASVTPVLLVSGVPEPTGYTWCSGGMEFSVRFDADKGLVMRDPNTEPVPYIADPRVLRACDAAKSARFEFGESGARL